MFLFHFISLVTIILHLHLPFYTFYKSSRNNFWCCALASNGGEKWNMFAIFKYNI